MLFRGAARLCLPLGPLAARISGEDYALQEPPDATSEWVDLLAGLLGGLQERLQAAAALPEMASIQVGCWPEETLCTPPGWGLCRSACRLQLPSQTR